jgi:hypothetical protein
MFQGPKQAKTVFSSVAPIVLPQHTLFSETMAASIGGRHIKCYLKSVYLKSVDEEIPIAYFSTKEAA